MTTSVMSPIYYMFLNTSDRDVSLIIDPDLKYGEIVHIILSLVWVAEWPPFGKELFTMLTICSLCIFTLCNFRYFPFWF